MATKELPNAAKKAPLGVDDFDRLFAAYLAAPKGSLEEMTARRHASDALRYIA